MRSHLIAPAGVAVLLLGLAQSDCGTAVPPGSEAQPAPSETTASNRPLVYAVGTVQDGGLPHAACDCARCAAARQQPDRARRVASLAIVLPGTRQVYLIDATPDLSDQLHALRGFRPDRTDPIDRAPVDGVLLTHAHIGHYLGLAFFGFEAVYTRQLPVFCSARLASYLRENGPWSQLVGMGNVELREIREGVALDLGEGVEVTPVAVPHRDEYADTMGFIIRGPAATVLYVPDTDSWRAWDVPIERSLEGIDVAILDGTFYATSELPGRDPASIGHPLITDSMDRLEPLVRSGRLRVFFTHLNHSNPALDPEGPELREIRRRGFDVLAEGQIVGL